MEEWAAVNFRADLRSITFGDHYPAVPDTAGRWRHLGYYLLAPADARTLAFQLQPMKGGPKGAFIDLDDLRLRTATFEEMSAAYAGERAGLPALRRFTPSPATAEISPCRSPSGRGMEFRAGRL